MLRRLAYPGAAETLDDATVMRAIDDIIAEISRAGTVRTGTFLLLIPKSSGLATAVAVASEGAIESDQRKLQLDWAAADVAGGATLFVPPRSAAGSERLTLVTATMVYSLKPFTEPTGEASWDIAFCENAVPGNAKSRSVLPPSMAGATLRQGGRRSREQKGSVAKLHLHAVARPMLGVIRWHRDHRRRDILVADRRRRGCPTGKSMPRPEPNPLQHPLKPNPPMPKPRVGGE